MESRAELPGVAEKATRPADGCYRPRQYLPGMRWRADPKQHQTGVHQNSGETQPEPGTPVERLGTSINNWKKLVAKMPVP
ncbi:MAG: hypothetical protein CM1200mP20_03650 [Pseudomonadota bacterium]|nr:MAG: hypothetical protein CM1200mP20_03650 [Pseudomonadota bacterium]